MIQARSAERAAHTERALSLRGPFHFCGLKIKWSLGGLRVLVAGLTRGLLARGALRARGGCAALLAAMQPRVPQRAPCGVRARETFRHTPAVAGRGSVPDLTVDVPAET